MPLQSKTAQAGGRAASSSRSEVEGKESMAMEGFAKALQQIPAIIADNGGFDSADLVGPPTVGQLRAAHARGEHSMMLECSRGSTANMAELGIMESFKSSGDEALQHDQVALDHTLASDGQAKAA